ncbi:MAG: hypothetical protein ACI4IE_00120 [Eubacterium sp.]
MKSRIILVIISIICMIFCSCGKATSVPNEEDVKSNEKNIETSSDTYTIEDNSQLIEKLDFQPNDVVVNSKPKDLYIQIGDVYFSPTEKLTVNEFIKRANGSSMNLKYQICEDDISDKFVEYSQNYLVAGGEDVDIFFYCDNQLLFKLNALNITDKTLSLGDCYAFTMSEMHELFSNDAVDTKSISWYCNGVPFGGGDYSYSSIKALFDKWDLSYEETEEDGNLLIYSKLEYTKIDIKYQNGYVSFIPYYSAKINKSTGNVEEFSYSFTGYNYGTN